LILIARNPSLTSPPYPQPMSLKKPFRAAPVRLGAYQLAEQRQQQRSGVAKILTLAAIGGIGLGGVVGLAQGGDLMQAASSTLSFVRTVGSPRTSTPQAGDYWSGCNAARAAGVAPLYSGEPGYRPEMDGDSDGIACEPYRGY
jgi:Excalibur calcium-binding domain